MNKNEPIEPERPAVSGAVTGSENEETLRTEVERAWLEWWDGETNPNAIDGGWMWREGYLAGRRAHESNSPNDPEFRDAAL